MNTSTSRWRGPVAALIGALLVLTALAAPAQAGIARTISVRTSSTAAIAGTPVIVAGNITNSPAGSNIVIEQQVGTSWLTIRRTETTGSDGAFRVDLLLSATPGIYSYRVFAPSGGGRNSAVSRTFTLKAQYKVSASLKATPTSVAVGGRTTLAGKFSRGTTGAAVALQRYNGVSWSKIATLSLTSAKTVSKVLVVKATFSYRIVMAASGLNATATSVGVRVSVPAGPAAPVITTSAMPDGNLGTAYNVLLTGDSGAGTWSKLSGVLPNGLALSKGGRVSGTPTKVGTYTFKVVYVAPSGRAVAKTLSIEVVNGPAIMTTSLPAGSRGTAYPTTTLTKTGAAGTWSMTGALPTGITFDEGLAKLSGTPSVDGTFPLTFTFTETSSGLVASKPLQLVIADPPDPTVTTTSLPDGVRTEAYGPVQLQRTGNAGTWTMPSGTLPAGVTLSSGGLLSGTPTTTGDFFPTVRFTEANGTFDEQALLLHVSAVNAPVIANSSLDDGTVGAAYSVDLNATPAGGSWSITFGELPDGLSLNQVTGVISGTPTTAGDSYFIVKYTTLLNGNNTKFLSIHVDPA